MADKQDPETKEQPKEKQEISEQNEEQENIEETHSENGARIRKLTEKGRIYSEQQIEKSFSSLKSLCTRITGMVNNQEPEEMIRQKYRDWMDSYDDFLDRHYDHSRKLNQTDLAEYLKGYDERETFLQNFKTSLQEYFASQAKIKDQETKLLHEDGDNRSFGHGQFSSVSAVSSRKLAEEEKRAELEAKKESLKKKKEIELAKVALKMEEEELEIETNIAMAKAKTKVFDKFEQSEFDQVHTDTRGYRAPETFRYRKTDRHRGEKPPEPFRYRETDRHRGEKPPEPFRYRDTERPTLGPLRLNPNAETFYPMSYERGEFPSSSASVQAVVKHLRKPTPEIKKFGGNPLDYRKFLRQFNAKVVINCDNDDEKMNYLEQLTFGEANKVVSGYSHLSGERAFEAAMRQLEERYGDTDVIATAFIRKALEWPSIRPGDVRSLDEFALFLVECLNGAESIDAGRVLEYSENIKRLMSKLPVHLHDRWRNVVLRIKDAHRTVKFKDFVDFVKAEAKKVNDPTYGFQQVRGSSSLQKPKGVSCEVTKLYPTQKCVYCNSVNHTIDRCRKILELNRDDRIVYLRRKGLCFGCLKQGHLSSQCRKRLKCTECSRQHPTILHNEDQRVKNNQLVEEVSVCGKQLESSTFSKDDSKPSVNAISSGCHEETEDISCAMAIIPVRVKLKNKPYTVETYAFFDSGSSVSFCTEDIMYQLGAHGKKTQITINTMGDTQKLNTYVMNGLQVSGLTAEHFIDLPKLYTKKQMPVSNQEIPTKEEIRKWSHLQSIPFPEVDANIGILIGNNVPDAYTPFELAVGPRGSPHATRTRLGWIPWNIIRNRTTFDVNHVCIQNDGTQLDHILKQIMNFDFPEAELMVDDKKEYSLEDKNFLQQVENSIQFENGHYHIGLPFRRKDVVLPNNSAQCLKRLEGLKCKFMKNPQFKDHYVEFMDKILQKGYAEPVPEDELNEEDGRIWFLPHHGIYHPKKPNKIRVVFDCSAKFMGVSLNNQLLQGPNLANNLLGVLMRFRQEEIAILGDIESMFYQVKVPEKDRNFLRFYWWKDGDIDQKPLQYRMTVHLFGATSSPSCCHYALQITAEKHKEQFAPIVTDTVKRNMYVDDCLTSVAAEETAVSLIKDVSALCKMGGFYLTKFISNSEQVLESVPEIDRVQEVEKWNLSDETLVERALGVYWFIKKDVLGFQLNNNNQPATRRGILSIVSSVYDPLGIVSPFILTAKSILQNLCKRGISWDEEIPAKELVKWNTWLQQLPDLEKINVSRCYKSANFKNIVNCQLHCFADASEIGYGAVFYLRLLNEDGHVHCAFVLGKSRVAPLKSVSVPRLELTAATSAVKLCRMIMKELDYLVHQVCYWTDSMTVIRYISNKTTRFHTFIANHLAIIHEATEVEQWRYVDTKQNPADLASRGMNMEKFLKTHQWLQGPDFLWNDEDEWPKCCENLNIPSDDPEVRRPVNVCTNETTQHEGVERLIHYCSDWFKLIKMTAWLIVVKEYLKSAVKAEQEVTKEDRTKERKKEVKKKLQLTIQKWTEAEKALMYYVQQKHFSEEIEALKNMTDSGKQKSIGSKSPLRKFDPFLDKDGLLRVGGRLERAEMSFDAKHPIILPKNSPVSSLIIKDAHQTIGHLGKNSILSVLRQKYWIIGASVMIKSLVSRCVICKKHRGVCEKQKMADLPEERLKADEPPFTRLGMDFFGPFEVKQGRSTLKRYGVIFTCLVTRAIHLELAFSLDTDSCINAIRRFIARRGIPAFIRSDNGTNLVGAAKEMSEEIQRWNLHQIHEFMLQKKIQWEFNPPAASHFGGVWERLIRSVRKVLYSVMCEQNIRISDEGLSTLFCEVEAILNGRPITEMSEDVRDVDALTPNHLLLLRPGERFPPGLFDKKDNYVRRRWRQIQYLADIFWARWKNEYLQLLQKRQKWTQPTRNMKVGDIVLVMDNSPRNSWIMGRVIETMKDRDDVVRVVKVKTGSSTLMRPIRKLCLLVESE
ncbi:uncharacterized protein LOC134249947 [Saccostrea cucullata]|uniref:uncharacterized protein LOC134249947 n=1 Tax=Saccostrea cuccullata TaxID=36930 RepID=UPI002ED1D87C